MGSGRIKLAGIAAAGAIGLPLGLAPSALGAGFNCAHRVDNFNRHNSSTLGSAWTEQAFDIGIQAHRAFNANSDFALATLNGVKSNSACVDVYAHGSRVDYVAIDLGYKDLSNNIFIKVQDNNSSGDFDTAFAYRGNNSFSPLVTHDIKHLTPFTKAEIYVTWKGSAVKLEISTKFNQKAQQTYVFRNVQTAGLGKKVGLGIFNGASADNFAIP
jgi:hypothetical protein